jgi:hypothetical protein
MGNVNNASASAAPSATPNRAVPAASAAASDSKAVSQDAAGDDYFPADAGRSSHPLPSAVPVELSRFLEEHALLPRELQRIVAGYARPLLWWSPVDLPPGAALSDTLYTAVSLCTLR